MMFKSWINRSLFPLATCYARPSRSRKVKAKRPHRQRLYLESLEARELLSAVSVTNSLDIVGGDTSSIEALVNDPGTDGTISLREAILASNNTAGANSISFDPVTSGVPIRLTQGRLSISNS